MWKLTSLIRHRKEFLLKYWQRWRKISHKAHADQFGNLEFLYLGLGHEAALRGDKEKCLYYYNRLSTDKLKTLFINSFNPDLAFQYVALAVSELVKYDNLALAEKLVKVFDGTINRSSVYAYAASNLQWQGINDSRVSMLIDSAQLQIAKTSNLTTIQPNRLFLAHALAMRNQDGDIAEAYRTLKNVEIKFQGIARICRSLASRGELYESSQNVPANISDVDNIVFVWNTVVGYGEA